MENVEFKQVTTSNGVSSGFVTVCGETFAFSAKAGEWAEVEPKDPEDLDFKRQERDAAQKAVEESYHVDHRNYFTANDAGEVGCHDCELATAQANCERMREQFPDDGWEVLDASDTAE